jgi:hypothetical protein
MVLYSSNLTLCRLILILIIKLYWKIGIKDEYHALEKQLDALSEDKKLLIYCTLTNSIKITTTQF